MKIRILLPLLSFALAIPLLAEEPATKATSKAPTKSATTVATDALAKTAGLEKATFGGGCFWCTEGIFEKLDAVKDAKSGYTGGKTKDPTYEQICTGDTGHAEVVELLYDPKKITFEQLLDIHFKSHDPTTLNRQGNDKGTQYRSVVFYHNDAQKAAAEKAIKALDKSGTFKNPVVTQVMPVVKFYEAEEYHQDFQKKNPGHGYLRHSLNPKLLKLEDTFKKMNEGK